MTNIINNCYCCKSTAQMQYRNSTPRKDNINDSLYVCEFKYVIKCTSCINESNTHKHEIDAIYEWNNNIVN